ncbi:MAG TPA: chemotaxis protein CheW [Anaeromyxobacteraceae bacterium]|nr:chemotaxis protein CheW [Anaeromyxobacteraceae bacterium]
MPANSRHHVLLVRAGARVCALPIADVIETFRPLPVSPLAATPPFVLGVAVVRGEPAPVISLGQLLSGTSGPPPSRFVGVRCGARVAALAVEAVLGVSALPDGLAPGLPLLEQAGGAAVEAAGVLGSELLLLLRSARVVPEECWAALAAEVATR